MKTQKFKKYILIIILAFILALSVLMGAGGINIQDDSDSYYVNSNLIYSMAAFDTAMANFRVPAANSFNARGTGADSNLSYAAQYIYCDNFAGVWYCDRGLLNIGVVQKPLQIAAQRANNFVVYTQKQFSHNFLAALHEAVSELYGTYSVHAVATLPQYNKLEVAVSDFSDIARVRAALLNKELYKPNSIYFNVRDMASAQSLQQPISAADGIMQTNGGRGTISTLAVCNATGQRGILTNAHVAPATPAGAWFRHYTVRTAGGPLLNMGQYIGQVAQWQMHGLIDAAFVPFARAQYWEFNPTVSYYFDPQPPTDPQGEPSGRLITHRGLVDRPFVVATRNQIQVGLPIMSTGQTTGRTYGNIRAINQSVWVRVHGEHEPSVLFTNQISHSARTLPGDSGSPLFIMGANQMILAGTDFAGGGGFHYASKITYITSILNITIVCHNFNPTISNDPIPTGDYNATILRFPFNLGDTNVFASTVDTQSQLRSNLESDLLLAFQQTREPYNSILEDFARARGLSMIGLGNWQALVRAFSNTMFDLYNNMTVKVRDNVMHLVIDYGLPTQRMLSSTYTLESINRQRNLYRVNFDALPPIIPYFDLNSHIVFNRSVLDTTVIVFPSLAGYEFWFELTNAYAPSLDTLNAAFIYNDAFVELDTLLDNNVFIDFGMVRVEPTPIDMIEIDDSIATGYIIQPFFRLAFGYDITVTVNGGQQQLNFDDRADSLLWFFSYTVSNYGFNVVFNISSKNVDNPTITFTINDYTNGDSGFVLWNVFGAVELDGDTITHAVTIDIDHDISSYSHFYALIAWHIGAGFYIDIELNGQHAHSIFTQATGLFARRVSVAASATSMDFVITINAPNVLKAPIINTVDNQTVQSGAAITPINLTLYSAGYPTQIVWSIVGSSHGLTINTQTGVISGTVSATEDFTLTVRATNATGYYEITINFTVLTAPPPPVAPILDDIAIQVVEVGDRVTIRLELLNQAYPSVTWIILGSTHGLGISQNGVISGTIITETNFSILVRVINSVGSDEVLIHFVIFIEPTSVVITGGNQTTINGQQVINLSAQVLPTNAFYKLVWTSSNAGVATISQNGVVTILGSGTTVIRVEIYGTQIYAETTININPQDNYDSNGLFTTCGAVFNCFGFVGGGSGFGLIGVLAIIAIVVLVVGIRKKKKI